MVYHGIMPTTTMTSKGQVTIPIEARRALSLKQGSRLNVSWTDGVCILAPATRSITVLAGFFGEFEGTPVTVEEMNETVTQAMSEQA